MFKKEDLPPLPEGAHLSLSSPPPALPALPPMLFELPPPFQTTPSLNIRSDSTWATTAGLSPQGVMAATILGIPGHQLFHPQPHSIPVTFGTTLTSHMPPISLQELAPPITEPLPPTQQNIPASFSGTNPSRTKSSHSSLYQELRNLSLDPPLPTNPLGEASMSGISKPTHHSTDSENQSGSEGGQARQATQTPPQSHSPSRSISMGSTERVPSHPPSCRSIHSMQQIQTLPTMTLSNAIHLYESTRFSKSTDEILGVLIHAHYNDLFNYFSYELPFIPAWGETEAGNDYFMNQQHGLPSDQILQYEAGRNACLLYNKIH